MKPWPCGSTATVYTLSYSLHVLDLRARHDWLDASLTSRLHVRLPHRSHQVEVANVVYVAYDRQQQDI